MALQFHVTIPPPPDIILGTIETLLANHSVPSARDFTSLCQSIESNLNAACQFWASYIDSAAKIWVEVHFCDPACNGLASGRSFSAIDIKNPDSTPTMSTPRPDYKLIHEGAAYAIVKNLQTPHLPNGDSLGILINLPPNNYLTQTMWFDPNPLARSKMVPRDRLDAVTLFLHELAHALGMNGRLEQSGPNMGNPKQEGAPPHPISKYDEHVKFNRGDFFFHGPTAMAENHNLPVPLGRAPNNNYHHVGNDSGQRCDCCRCDLMTAFPWMHGWRYYISRLDLAILKDVGLPIGVL
jgi:hypothetical protein